jgi:hypothetical protein
MKRIKEYINLFKRNPINQALKIFSVKTKPDGKFNETGKDVDNIDAIIRDIMHDGYPGSIYSVCDN